MNLKSFKSWVLTFVCRRATLYVTFRENSDPLLQSHVKEVYSIPSSGDYIKTLDKDLRQLGKVKRVLGVIHFYPNRIFNIKKFWIFEIKYPIVAEIVYEEMPN